MDRRQKFAAVVRVSRRFAKLFYCKELEKFSRALWRKFDLARRLHYFFA